jgi:hypothetical protein
MKLIGTQGLFLTVELSATDCLALVDTIEEACSTAEQRPYTQALGAALHAAVLYAWRLEDRDGPDGDYSAGALRRAWGIKENAR